MVRYPDPSLKPLPHTYLVYAGSHRHPTQHRPGPPQSHVFLNLHQFKGVLWVPDGLGSADIQPSADLGSTLPSHGVKADGFCDMDEWLSPS